MQKSPAVTTLILAATLAVGGVALSGEGLRAGIAQAQGNPIFKTKAAFLQAEKNITKAIKKNKMGLVSKASATAGAAAIGVKIKGNRVFGVYHPRFAVQMLKASIPAGIEAPIRIYMYENADGAATITYKNPPTFLASMEATI